MKVIIREYRGNAQELNNRSFIELIDSISESPLPEIELLTDAIVPDKGDASGSAQSAFSIYPNPGNGIFTVEKVMWDEESLNLRIFDMQGRLVTTMPMQQQRTAMDLSAYGTGTYVVMVVSEDAVLSTQKVVVE